MKKQTPKAVLDAQENKNLMQELDDMMRRLFGCSLSEATEKQVYRALCNLVREYLTEKNGAFNNAVSAQ